MSMYNMLFGRNPQSALLLAAIGFKENDVERFRDVSVEDEARTVSIYTRTGGGNRSDYPQLNLYRSPLFKTTADDDFDSTYATFYFSVPDEYVADVAGLTDIFANGLRKEFGEYLLKTLRREPTDADKATAEYEAEEVALKRVPHKMANGHTFVPEDDFAMRAALELAEKNNGDLRTCWGILPLMLTVKRDNIRWPGMKGIEGKFLTRLETGYDWTIDEPYWAHCQEMFAEQFPIAMTKVKASVDQHLARKKSA